MKVRIYEDTDGRVSVIYPTINEKIKKENENNEDTYLRIAEMATPTGVKYFDVEDSLLPDRKDRDFWVLDKNTGTINIDNVKKQEKNYKKLIKEEEEKILMEQAIQNLKDSGKLPQDYKNEII